MRKFIDASGKEWDVVVGRESWGALYALFVPAGPGRSEPIRQTMLRASGYDAAQFELEEMDDAALAALFEKSTPKPD